MVKEKQCRNKSNVLSVLSWFSARLFDCCDTQLKEILLTDFSILCEDKEAPGALCIIGATQSTYQLFEVMETRIL